MEKGPVNAHIDEKLLWDGIIKAVTGTRPV